MCGDLDEYDPGKHVELLLDGIKKHIGAPRVASSSCPTGAPSPSTFRFRRLPSSSAIPSAFQGPTRRTILSRVARRSSERCPR